MKVVLNCDDFGLAYSFTEGVKRCFLEGAVTSASIRTNGPAYEYAKDLVKRKIKKLGIGLHLNLTDGESYTEELADLKGYYKYDFLNLYLSLKSNKTLVSAIEKDIKNQLTKALEDGLELDHVDSEKHVHMIPLIFEIVCKLCCEYKIKYVRLVREPYYFTGSFKKDVYPWLHFNTVKYYLLNYFSKQNYETLKRYKLRSTDAFYGVLQTNNMLFSVINAILDNAKENSYQLIEILSHPAYPNDPKDVTYTSKQIAHYANIENRLMEAKALKDSRLADYIRQNKIDTVSYKDLY